MHRSFPTSPGALALLAGTALALSAATTYAQTPTKPAPPAALTYASSAPVQTQPLSAAAKPADKTPVQPASAKAEEAAARHRRHHQAVHRNSVQTVLHDAEVKATEVPRPAAMVNATLHYTYEPGKLYTIHTAPSFLTAVVLRPGERLIAKAAGDTVRWEVGETTQGSSQVVILIKPLDAGLRTNMILTTDQRVYVLDLVSGEMGDDHSTLVDWRYPAEEMRELTLTRAVTTVQALAAQGAALNAGAALPASPLISAPGAPAPAGPGRMAGPPGIVQPTQAAAAAEAAQISPAALNFNYKVVTKGHTPAWTPEHVFDDGHKVFVKFPSNVSTMEIPPLFVIGPKGEAELVNYHFDKGYYVVDRLFQVAELRLGSKDQSVVQLVYKGAGR